jgi:hypothetical protein
LEFRGEAIFCFRKNTDFRETELGSRRVFETEVFEIHTDRSDFGEQTSEFPGHVINKNDQLGKVLCDTVLPGNSSNTGVSVRKTLRNCPTSPWREWIGESPDNGVEVVSIVPEDANNLVGIGSENLHPEFRLATGNSRRVAKSLPDETDGGIASVEKASGKKRGNDLRNMRNKSDAAIVFRGIQSNGSSAEVESERFDRRIGGTTIGDSLMVCNYPRSADEQIGASGYCTSTLTSSHRMGANIPRDICTESTQFTKRSELHTRDIGYQGRWICGQLGRNGLRDNVRRNTDNNERRFVAIAGGSSGAVVDGETHGRR